MSYRAQRNSFIPFNQLSEVILMRFSINLVLWSTCTCKNTHCTNFHLPLELRYHCQTYNMLSILYSLLTNVQADMCTHCFIRHLFIWSQHLIVVVFFREYFQPVSYILNHIQWKMKGKYFTLTMAVGLLC